MLLKWENWSECVVRLFRVNHGNNKRKQALLKPIHTAKWEMIWLKIQKPNWSKCSGEHTCFFFFGLLFRRGLWASELELRLLLWSVLALETPLLWEETLLVLYDVLLEVDTGNFLTDWFLFAGWFLIADKGRGGGMRARADICLCIDVKELFHFG